MPRIRETAQQRIARIELFIVEIEAMRDVAQQQLQNAQRSIDECDATLKRLRAELAQYQKSRR